MSRHSKTLQEAINDFKHYSDQTTLLYERTKKCFGEIEERLNLGQQAGSGKLIASSQLNDVERELRKTPTVVFIGERNCGKSSIINELLKQTYLPVHENPCTARIVRIKHADELSARLVGADGNVVRSREDVKGKKLLEKLIVVSDKDRENPKALDATVEFGLNHELLKSGIELIDSPGKNESDVLDRVLEDFLEKGTVPLFVYVIDGKMRLRPSDVTTLTFLKDKSPQSSIMFVCNKVDIEATGPLDDDDDDDDDEDDDDDDDEEDEDDDEDEDNENKKTKKKKEVVFNQLKSRGFLAGESSKTCDLFHAISAKDVREERKKEGSEGEATRRFQRFQGQLQILLAHIMKTQTKRIVQALLVLQESFVNVVQVQRSQITQEASIVPEITRQAYQIESKMFDSLKSFTSSDSEDTKQRLQEHIKSLKEEFSQDALQYKIPNQRTMRKRALTMIKTDLKVAFSPEQLSEMNREDFILERFLGDMKGNILEKMCNSLDKFVESLMDKVASDLIKAIIDFNENLTHPMVSKILEESYGVHFVEAKAKTHEVIEDILNHLLDSIKEAARVALRKEISGPLSSKQMTTCTKRDVADKTRRQLVVESLFDTIDEKRVAKAVFEACFDRFQRMRDRFLSTMEFLMRLQRAFSNCQATEQLEDLRLRFTPEIRMLAVEGMALKYVQNHGPIACGSLVAKTRHGQLFDCASVSWYRCSPSGQCVVKVIEKEKVGESAWKQNAVDLVNMMDMIQKLKGSHPNLLRLYGWVFPKPDVLHVVMEKAEKSLLCALKELASAWARSSLSKLITRIKMALDVAEGLKAIHEIGYIHEDIKPGNILLMSDGRATINLAKPECPYDMTTLGAPFHVSPEMYQYHGKGHLSYLSYDIYAFGMLLWVLFEGRGTSRPKVYKDMKTIQSMQAAVENGILPCKDDKELQIPSVSDACWSLMTRCWEDRASMTMDIIITDLKAIRETVETR